MGMVSVTGFFSMDARLRSWGCGAIFGVVVGLVRADGWVCVWERVDRLG